MKKGKELKVENFKDYNIVYGSVNNKNPKAIYINISSWAEPKNNTDINYNRIIKDNDKSIRQIIFNFLNNNQFAPFHKERTIVDFDMRESGVKYGKKSFVNCEITLYLRYEIPVNSYMLKPIVDDLIENIVKIGFDDNDHFRFHKKKK